MSEHLRFDINEKVATIRIDRPEKLNAFTDDMLLAWVDALEECRSSDAVNVIVITGTGGAFTTGGDTTGFAKSAASTSAGIRHRLTDFIHRLPLKLDEIDKPVIAALNGIATGGGLDIALMCDMRYAAQSARFAETYASLALIPGLGGAYLLPRLIGTPRARELLWSADFIDAQEAERIGLVNRVYPDDELMDRTYEYAGRIANASPLAIRLIKRMTRQDAHTDLRAALDLAASNMSVVRGGEDHDEALRALKERRPPQFKGK
ncbi:enoyl-CoA hydratase-related protein [Comamonadaceae bacterium G21597-S1]|nr:enoyl-CoA hydratase-related protein [Comamonadaceae bacterium G21597-S1]